MAPYTEYSQVVTTDDDDYFDFEKLWHDISDWFLRTIRGLNHETEEHPYFMSFALIVVFAWPHILFLPIWFGKDAVRRVDIHARDVGGRLFGIEPPRRRKRDALKSHYQAIVSARYDNQPGPSSGSGSAAQFGGTPLTSGEFAPEEDQDLHIVLRVIRWFALMLAAIILGREWFRVLSHY